MSPRFPTNFNGIFSQYDKKEGTLYAVFQIGLELFLTTLTNTSIIWYWHRLNIFLEIGELHDILFPNINKNQAMNVVILKMRYIMSQKSRIFSSPRMANTCGLTGD